MVYLFQENILKKLFRARDLILGVETACMTILFQQARSPTLRSGVYLCQKKVQRTDCFVTIYLLPN